MTTKREWLHNLKAFKKEPRALTPAECDELILLLGGTGRPNHRPEITVFGINRRQANWGGIVSVVFSFMENAERLAQLEVEFQELSRPDYLKKGMGTLSHKTTEKKRVEYERIAEENLAAELLYLQNSIDVLRPISTKKRADAESKTKEWFEMRGEKKTLKFIQNELDALRQKAGLRRLQLSEWRELKTKADAYAEQQIKRALEEIEKN